MKTNEVNGFFPMFVDLSDKRIVVIGAGKIASRRIQTLTKFCRMIDVYAPKADPLVLRLEQEGKLTFHQKAYEREALYGADIVIAGTNDTALNQEIHSVCKCLGITVNVISDQTKCDFHFPGIVKKENLVIGINAGGKDHRLTRTTREKIEKMMGED